ncbi:MAG: LytTR family DNA-binding domain-containing protein [Ginsengibacter sp.]|jgi:DNA-binding LytR/AlgR family response regulator
MIQAIAVDDELNALGIIEEFSKKIPHLNLLKTFTDPTKVLQYTSDKSNKIDLIFLDIQMSRLNGLTLAEHLPEETRIILTTAYPDYALQGYEMDVIDYLLKPFSFDRFNRAVHKMMLLKDRNESETGDGLKLKPTGDDFIFVRTDYKTLKVKIADILYIEGSGNYVTLHTPKGKILVLQNLKKFEDQLKPYQFMRVHRSFIISFNHIDSIEKGWILINNIEIPIGDSYREVFQQFLNQNYKQF